MVPVVQCKILDTSVTLAIVERLEQNIFRHQLSLMRTNKYVVYAFTQVSYIQLASYHRFEYLPSILIIIIYLDIIIFCITAPC